MGGGWFILPGEGKECKEMEGANKNVSREFRGGGFCGVPFLDKRIRFIFVRDKWIKLKFLG